MKLSASVHPLRFALLLLALAPPLHAALPTDEAGVIAYLTEKGLTITKNAEGRAVTLKSSGQPPMTAEEYALIGKLTQLEEVGINGAPLADGEWGFLKSLPKLKTLSVWHSGKFGSLENFSGLPVESLTVGGCVGLRDAGKGAPTKAGIFITTLNQLPGLRKVSLYHCPTVMGDAHLAHLVAQFPKLENARLDFAPTPVSAKTTVTPAGLAALQKLPLTTLAVENAHSFTAEHFQAIAGIKTLKTLTVDARKQAAPTEAIASFQQARPDVEVAISQPGDKGPPQVKKK